MKIPEDPRKVSPDLVVGYRRPRSTLEAERYKLKAAEKGHEAQQLAHERQMQAFESDRVARTINFVGNLTEAGIKFADQLIQNEAARQLENAEVLVDQGFNDVKLDLFNNPYEQEEAGIAPPGAEKPPQRVVLRHDKVWEEAKDKIKEDVLETLTNPRAKKAFETWYEGESQKFGQELQWNARTIMKTQQKVDSNNNIEYWISKGRIDKVNELLAAGRVTGLYDPAEIDKIGDSARGTIAYNIAKGAARSLGYENGIKFLNSPEMGTILKKQGLNPEDLTGEMRDKIEKELLADFNNMLAENEKAKKEYTHKTNDDFVTKLATGYDLGKLKKEVLTSHLDPIGQGGKQWWIDKIDAKLKADVKAIDTEENQNYIDDQDKKATLDRLILQDKKDEAYNYLMNNAGADKDGNPGISLDDVDGYKKDILKEKTDAMKAARKEGIELIDNAFKRMIKTVETPETKIVLDTANKRLATKFRNSITDDMSPDEIVKKADEILNEENITFISKRLDDLSAGWVREKKREEKRLELIRGIGIEKKDEFNQSFYDLMGAWPERTGTDPNDNMPIVGYQENVYKWDGKKWLILVDEEKDKWKKYKK